MTSVTEDVLQPHSPWPAAPGAPLPAARKQRLQVFFLPLTRPLSALLSRGLAFLRGSLLSHPVISFTPTASLALSILGIPRGLTPAQIFTHSPHLLGVCLSASPLRPHCLLQLRPHKPQPPPSRVV